jgi:hypothetical protein
MGEQKRVVEDVNAVSLKSWALAQSLPWQRGCRRNVGKLAGVE